MTTPSLSAPAFVAAGSRAVAGAGRAVTDHLALPVLLVGLTLCLAGYTALAWWLLQSFLALIG